MAVKHNVFWRKAIYLGIAGYGTEAARDRDRLGYRFFQNSEEKCYRIANLDGSYPVQNMLMEGHHYRLLVRGDMILRAEEQYPTAEGELTALVPGRLQMGNVPYPLVRGVMAYRMISRPGGTRVERAHPKPGDWVRLYGSPATWVELARRPQPYQSPVPYSPGLRTLKNLLSAALQPVGKTLYVYGGGWNWQDDGSAPQAMTLGVPASWGAFFRERGANYCYRRQDGGPDWYPRGNYNQYYYAGADCSGYLGWVLWQVLGPNSGGFVGPAVQMARRLAEEWGAGTWSRPLREPQAFLPGDIVSIRGHVWLCLGRCRDGSLVILHSTPSPSRIGCPGGGVQLSGVGEGPGCQALALAWRYMEGWYPGWSRRYEPVWKPFGLYTDWAGTESAGRFRWYLDDRGLGDPEGIQTMGAEEILRLLYPSSPAK